MLSYTHAYNELLGALQPLYDERETAAIADRYLEHISGKTRLQRRMGQDDAMPAAQEQQFYIHKEQLAAGMPLQYVTHSAWFMGREYYVNEHVLIPRPETEELADWIIREHQKTTTSLNILDIGTGSGCIPISLKLAMPQAIMTTCDVSQDAIAVAQKNAKHLMSDVQLLQIDFLDAQQHTKLQQYDVIVSNPPYIPAMERQQMHTNVKDYEPEIALFVPDNDALVFYRAIAQFGRQHLTMGGAIYCELDAGHAHECKTLFEKTGYKNVELKKDMHDNWRMLKAY